MSRRSDAALAAKDAEIALYREAIDLLGIHFAALADGDLEPRLPALPDLPGLASLRDNANRSLDLIDAFVRESGATLAAAAERRYHRRFLTQGVSGALRDSARRIDDARGGMAAAAAAVASHESARRGMTDSVGEVSVHVAAASTELGASAQALHQSARAGIDAAAQATQTVLHLQDSATEIQEAVGLIKKVAAQTRLLALNATIEAARAGEHGRGFSVVANEVKELADESTRFSDEITAQVNATQIATATAVGRIAAVSDAVQQIDVQATAITDAASGSGGLSRLAETLRKEMEELTSVTRVAVARAEV